MTGVMAGASEMSFLSNLGTPRERPAAMLVFSIHGRLLQKKDISLENAMRGNRKPWQSVAGKSHDPRVADYLFSLGRSSLHNFYSSFTIPPPLTP